MSEHRAVGYGHRTACEGPEEEPDLWDDGVEWRPDVCRGCLIKLSAFAKQGRSEAKIVDGSLATAARVEAGTVMTAAELCKALTDDPIILRELNGVR